VKRWNDLYSAWGGGTGDHPYPCDDSALHHVFDGGWMWVLPFDNGITSAGFSLNPDRFPLDQSIPPQVEWDLIIKRFPSVAEQFVNAEPTVPWRQTGRIQRRLQCSAGFNWVMLPNSATFLDPFYSTGNAFTLNGIDRLMDMLERSWRRPSWPDAMKEYDARIQQESEFLDLLVGSTFAGVREFPRMAAVSMFYFAAATWSESERRAGRVPRGAAFLAADQSELKAGLRQAAAEVRNSEVSTADFVSHVRSAIAPFNRVGLCDDARRGMYPFVTG
jgi:FADH2 O2-dependent halogenase